MTVVHSKKRIAVLFLGTLAALVVLAGRLVWLQFVQGEMLRGKAFESRTREVPIEARRGTIFDRTGRPLALSVNVESVYAIPPQVKDPQLTAEKIAEVLGMDAAEALNRITRREAFVWIARKIDDEQARQLKLLRLPGIGFTQEAKRFYPHATLAAHVLGVVGLDPKGLEGVEVTYDDYLKGIPGKIVVEYDARGRELPQALHRHFPSQDGMNLVLTLDLGLQYLAERELDRIMVEHRPKRAGVIIMDTKTGGILAMAMRPAYDANLWQDAPMALRRNWIIADSYPPGSTFKPVTAAAALEAGVVDWNDRFHDPGFINVPGKRISDWRAGGHGTQTLAEVIKNSCNVGFVQIGFRLGNQRFWEFYQKFGFTAPTGIDLPGEAVGLWMTPDQMRPVDLAVMSFGQTITVTAIQLVTALNAIANEGRLVWPHMLHEVRSPTGDLLLQYDPLPPRQVMAPETARELVSALELVVREGTGRRVYAQGYRMAGKTGTSQKVIGGRVASGYYVGSFVGFAPADDPQITVMVLVDEPTGSYFGGVVAAPGFANIVRDAFAYLNIPLRDDEPPEELLWPPPVVEKEPTGPPVAVPNLLRLPVETARDRLWEKGLGWQVQGDGAVVLEQVPVAGAQLLPGQSVLLRTVAETAGQDPVSVPRLEGQTIRQVGTILGKLGLRFAALGSGIAIAQDPAPGILVRPGSVIQVEFQPPTD